MVKATTEVNGLPESGTSARGRHPYLYGTLVAVVGFLLVAVPVAWSVFFAAASLLECSGGGPVSSGGGIFACHEPNRPAGMLFALVALVLLALPVIAGVRTARAVSRGSGPSGRLKILALVAILGMTVLCIILGLY